MRTSAHLRSAWISSFSFVHLLEEAVCVGEGVGAWGSRGLSGRGAGAGDFDPGIEPGSPALQADSLLSEPTGKPTNIEKGGWKEL